MTEVKAVTGFTDKKEGVFRKKGDTFSCSDDRAKELADLQIVKIVSKSKAPSKKKATKK